MEIIGRSEANADNSTGLLAIILTVKASSARPR